MGRRGGLAVGKTSGRGFAALLLVEAASQSSSAPLSILDARINDGEARQKQGRRLTFEGGAGAWRSFSAARRSPLRGEQKCSGSIVGACAQRLLLTFSFRLS